MGESDHGVEYLLQGFKSQKSLRYKNWKYIPPRRKLEQPEQLYNLAEDIGEQNNLVETNPEMTQHMRDMLDQVLTAEFHLAVDALAIHIRAVGALFVLQQQPFLLDSNLRVQAGNGPKRQTHRKIGTPADEERRLANRDVGSLTGRAQMSGEEPRR